MFSFLSGSTSGTKSPVETASSSTLKPAILVVIVPNQKDDFQKLFANETLANGRPIEVIEVMWSQFVVTVYPEQQTSCYLHLSTGRTIQPDFLLVRSEVRGDY
jgi:hypothetical protein